MPPTENQEFKRLHLDVLGIVQGVGFRWFTQKTANALNIKGWVRNHDSGYVEIEAEGLADSLDIFLIKIKKGPRSGRVDEVKVTDMNPVHETDFSIRN